MSAPMVSVAVITYNHGLFIRQCIEGILMQKVNFPIEIIIGEDCSTDHTRSVIQELESMYPDIIKPIYHSKNVGPARNAYDYCYPRLRGKYVAICEGDDYWTDPYKLQKQIDFLENNPDCALCYHNINYVNQDGDLIEEYSANKEIKYYSWDNFFDAHIPPLSVVYRNCISEIPKEIYHVLGADKFLFGMLAKHGKLANLGFVGAVYRRHSGGVYSSRNTLGKFRHTIYTRRLMKSSTYFTKKQRRMIADDIFKAKISYMKYFFKRMQLINFFKIAFS